MKRNKMMFWIFTILFCLAMLSTAIPELMGGAKGHAFMAQLGYPDSINTFLGIAKILGVITLLVPGFSTLKEWAYAGFTFDLIGATYAQIMAGMASPALLFMLVFFVLLFTSYISYRRLLMPQAAVAMVN